MKGDKIIRSIQSKKKRPGETAKVPGRTSPPALHRNS